MLCIGAKANSLLTLIALWIYIFLRKYVCQILTASHGIFSVYQTYATNAKLHSISSDLAQV